jgi:cytidylate kinase
MMAVNVRQTPISFQEVFMPVVTIRGPLGSGVAEIGREAAHLLSGSYVDKEIIEEISKLVGHPAKKVEEREYTPLSLRERIQSALEGSQKRSGSMESAFSRSIPEVLDDASYLDALKSVIQDITLEGNIVIHGRGSQFILRNNPSALHVLVVAPLPLRIKRVMEEHKVDEEIAAKQVEEYSKSRRDFIKRFFKKDMMDIIYYDLVVNTGNLSFELAAQIIIKALQKKTPWERG